MNESYESELQSIMLCTSNGDLEALMLNFSRFNEKNRKYMPEPDKNLFPCPGEDEILDEEKSVKWNKEEVNRQRSAYFKERDRLRTEISSLYTAYKENLSLLMGKKCGLSKEESCIVFARAWDSEYEDGIHAVYDEFRELAEMVSEVKRAGVKAGPLWNENTSLEDILNSNRPNNEKMKVIFEIAHTNTCEGEKCRAYLDRLLTPSEIDYEEIEM